MDKDYKEMGEYLPNITYPSFQATFMSGEVNFCVRGEDSETVMKGMKGMITDWKGWVANQGTPAAAPVVDANAGKTCTCGSAMQFIPSTGNISARWKCTNPTHKTKGKDGKMYAFTEWIS